MNELWTVLFNCNLAQKKGEQKMIVQKKTKYSIAVHGFTKVIAVNTKDRIMVLRIGFYSPNTRESTDDNPTSQWKLDKGPTRHIQEVSKKFCDEMKKFN